MNKVILASLVILGLVSAAMADNFCTSYTCGTMDQDLCGEYNSTGKGAWTLQSCKSGYYCSYSTTNFSRRTCAQIPSGTSVTVTYTYSKQVGDSCSAASECGTALCTDGKCAVVANGGACTQHAKCDKGSLCVDGKCTAAVANGGACTSSSQCAYTQQCVKINSASAVCTYAYSQATGTLVEYATGGTASSVCESGDTDSSNKCKALDTTSGGWPKVCAADSDCNAVSGSNGKCVCGGFSGSSGGYANPNGQGNCRGFNGDRGLAQNQNAAKYSYDCYPWQFNKAAEASAAGAIQDPDMACRYVGSVDKQWPSSFSEQSCYEDVGILDYYTGASVLSTSVIAMIAFVAAFFAL